MLIYQVTVEPTGNKQPVVSAFDFLLMAPRICKYNVISLWFLHLIRDRKSSVCQLVLEPRPAALCRAVLPESGYSWDYGGTPLSSEVSEGPHVFSLTTKMEMSATPWI